MTNEISALSPYISQENSSVFMNNKFEDQSNLQNSKADYFMLQSDSTLKHHT